MPYLLFACKLIYYLTHYLCFKLDIEFGHPRYLFLSLSLTQSVFFFDAQNVGGRLYYLFIFSPYDFTQCKMTFIVYLQSLANSNRRKGMATRLGGKCSLFLRTDWNVTEEEKGNAFRPPTYAQEKFDNSFFFHHQQINTSFSFDIVLNLI